MLKLPIGYDNFAKVIEGKFDFVDKSLFIKDILDDPNEVTVILRPRRFGKTLNLSMLQYFLVSEINGKSTEGLFENLKIMGSGEKYLQHQGKYPVIFITFKDVKSLSYEDTKGKMRDLFIRVYNAHDYLVHSDRLNTNQIALFNVIASGTADYAQLSNALYTLTELLAVHHGVNPWLLIDEYDSPIQSAYIHGYYELMIELMRGIFGAALKGNVYLKRAVITGILRIAKEDLFSGVNNS